jgi:hypothetical protein
LRTWPAYGFFPPQASDALRLDGGEELVQPRQRQRLDGWGVPDEAVNRVLDG